MKATRFEWTALVLVCITIVAAADNRAYGETIKLVSPASLENAEGGTSVRPSPGAHRVQWLFLASEFAGLPEGDHQLVAWNFRGDRTQTQPHSWDFSNVTLWMSTTDVTSLSTVYADNSGPDMTIVHDGPFSLPVLGSGPAGGPRDFAPGTQLDTPFRYDPSQGNLLIEWVSLQSSLTNSPVFDHYPSGSARFIVGTPNDTAGVVLADFPVVRFEFAAILNGDYNGNGLIEQADLDLVLLNWGRELADPVAAGWINHLPDGHVDQGDLDEVLLNWGSSAAITGAGVPEPSALLLVGVGVVAALAVRLAFGRGR